jgi:hypothetical protein
MAIKTFTTGEVLTASDTNTYLNNGGLVYINEVTYTGSTSASVTAQILGCFSATYQNYKIIISHTGSVSTTFAFRMISGTNTVDSGFNYFGYGLSYNAGTTDAGTAAVQQQKCGGHSSDSNIPNETVIDLANPNIAKRTQANIHAFDCSGPNMTLLSTQVATTTVYTGIQIFPASGSITGTMRVYGYRQA